MKIEDSVWIFVGEKSNLPSGVFFNRELAEAWIKEHSLTGLLTRYPVNVGLYEWATSNGYFSPKAPHHTSSKFIGAFSSAYLEHYHYENGDLPE